MSGQVVHLKVALIAAGLISCAAPLSSSAMQFGELTVHSHLGQPLRASIPLKAGPDEELDARCFSLARPEGQSDYASYLTQARLELVDTGGQLQLKIRSAQAVNEPFLRLLVQGNCGQGHLGREFTLLLDPLDAQIRSPAAASELQIPKPQEQYAWQARQGETLRSIAASLYPREKRMQRSLLRAIREANPELRDTPADALLPDGVMVQMPAQRPVASVPEPSITAAGKPRVVREAVKKPEAHSPAEPSQVTQPAAAEGGFRLKLSTSDLDLSMVGKMTEAQRQQLREKQLLLDADDQVANTLSMKNRIRQLEEQIDGMQKALEQTNNRMLLSEKMTTPAAQKAAPVLPDAGERESWLENTSFRSMAGVGLIVALTISGWWRWRRRQAEAQLESELEHEFLVSEMPRYQPLTPSSPGQHKASMAKPQAADQEEDFLSSATSIFAPEGESVTFTEAESVLDEADLYMAYGWANRAIELLQEYLEKHPDDIQLWKKLFEIYSSQGMKQEFEQLALRCQATMDDSGLWVLVQKLGRQLDAENPLYLSSPEEREEGTLQPSSEPGEGEVPTLDTPLDFVLDDKEPPRQDAGTENRHLELDPLFPELDQNTRLLPGNGDKAPG